MIFIIDLTIKAEEKVLRLWFFPPRSLQNHFLEMQNLKFSWGRTQTPFMLLLFSSARASIQTQIRHWSYFYWWL